MAYNNVTIGIGPDGRQGWTQSPDGRGTMTIIWSCAITMALTCWTVLVVNVHEPGSRYAITFRKFFLTILGITAPEAIFQVALAQWACARKSKQLFRAKGFKDWTLRHSFFVDMGALHVKFPDEKSFPINSEQLLWLVEREYVDYPQLSEISIEDRNKVDGTLRVLAVAQTLFFSANLIARGVQRLTITALELSTAAFVFLGIGMTIFWYRKPADVQRFDVIEAKVSLKDLFFEEKIPVGTLFTYTPLDFISREEWSWTILWSYGLSILRKLGLTSQPTSYPQQRISNTYIPKFSGWGRVVVAVVTLLYFSIYIAAWDFDFPTATEKHLWRAASITNVASVSIIWWVMQIAIDWQSTRRCRSFEAGTGSDATELATRSASQPSSRCSKQDRKEQGRFDRVISGVTNNSSSQASAFDTPVLVLALVSVLGFVYVVSRCWIFVEDIIELRSLPPGAYQSVNWMSLAPFVL